MSDPVSKGHSSGEAVPSYRFVGRVVAKAALLFLLINLVYIVLDPLPVLGRISLYNHLFPGRLRLPYSDDPPHSFNMSISQLDAMFASHILDGKPKNIDEYRILLIGDSSVWGVRLKPGETIADQLTSRNLTTTDGRKITAYNLGYPTLSATKDLLILDRALAYSPDLILWFVTLESMPLAKQLDTPLLTLNPEATSSLLKRMGLLSNSPLSNQVSESWWEKSILGQKRELADWIRFQLYGFAWAATSVDQAIPETYNQRLEDLPPDPTFESYEEGELGAQDLVFEVLKAGIKRVGTVPLLFVNEPIFISHGENSAIRYNFYYPRWAYDTYRFQLNENAHTEGWQLLDLWDTVPEGEFTDSAIHYSPHGVGIVVDALSRTLKNLQER